MTSVLISAPALNVGFTTSKSFVRSDESNSSTNPVSLEQIGCRALCRKSKLAPSLLALSSLNGMDPRMSSVLVRSRRSLMERSERSCSICENPVNGFVVDLCQIVQGQST